MTRLVMNVPNTAEGVDVEFPPYGLFKVGETVDLDYDVLDDNGNVIPIIYAHNPAPTHPVNDENTGVDDTPEEGE